MTKVKCRCDDLFFCSWLYALLKAAVEKTGPLMSVSIIWIGDNCQLHFVPPIIVFYWRESRTILSNSPSLNIITGMKIVFPVVIESVFTVAMISNCVRMSSKCCTRSCSCRGIRKARCYLNTAVAFRSRLISTSIFPVVFCFHVLDVWLDLSNKVFWVFKIYRV